MKGLVVCWSMARINDLWDRHMDQRKVRGLIPCCGQDGYRAQVPRRPIHSYNSKQLLKYTYKTLIYISHHMLFIPNEMGKYLIIYKSLTKLSDQIFL